MCSILVSGLPPEILEHILSFLPPGNILKMREVCHLFLDLFSSSHYLQHLIDLFSAGLVDNPHAVYSLTQRRARLREYVDGWKNTNTPAQYDRPLKSREALNPVGQNLFSANLQGEMSISFARVPLSLGQETIKEWTLELPFRFSEYVVWPQDNLLAVFELGVGSVNIHLLNLLDGSPHETPSKNVLVLGLGYYHRPIAVDMQISGSRVALVTEGLSSSAVRYHRELTVWDWKTGEVVLELSINHPGIGNVIASTTSIRLLEGSWLLVLSHRRPIAQLLVFNTALPQQDPRSWRILDLPPLSNSGNYSVVTQHEEPQDEFPEFSVDPAQRIFVVYSLPKSALVIPVGLLIQHMYSARTSSCVPWDEWGKDVVTVNLDPDTCLLQLFHTKILTLRIVPFLPQQWGVKVFDLSISGQRDVEAHQVVKGTSKRRQRVLPTPMWFILCPKGDTISRRVTIFGNAVYFFEWSRPSGEHLLRTWKFGPMRTPVNDLEA